MLAGEGDGESCRAVVRTGGLLGLGGPPGARGLSREYVLRIPSVSLKVTNWGGVSESPYKKVAPVSVP